MDSVIPNQFHFVLHDLCLASCLEVNRPSAAFTFTRWRRDFSTVHGGKLTEDYIRRVDTTYNRVARRFLPPPEKKWCG